MARLTSEFFMLCLLLLIRDFSDCCTYEEMSTGCRLEPSASARGGMECLCGVSCERKFTFASQAECEAQLKSGRAYLDDPCASNPCQNEGACVQSRFGRFRCECMGTNYYGDFCEKECPNRVGSNAFGYSDSDYPLDCIKI